MAFAGTFAVTLETASDFFEELLVLDVWDEMFESLFKLMLESLRSLLADEKPLLELVRLES